MVQTMIVIGMVKVSSEDVVIGGSPDVVSMRHNAGRCGHDKRCSNYRQSGQTDNAGETGTSKQPMAEGGQHSNQIIRSVGGAQRVKPIGNSTDADALTSKLSTRVPPFLEPWPAVHSRLELHLAAVRRLASTAFVRAQHAFGRSDCPSALPKWGDLKKRTFS